MKTSAVPRSLIAVIVVNILAAAYTMSVFLPTPNGTSVRPMGWSIVVFLIEGFSILLWFSMATGEVMHGKANKAAIATGLVLCLAPFPIAIYLFKFFVALKGLRILD